MPHLGDDAPLWPLIGCRRGPLRDALPVQVLCPALRREPKMEEMEEEYRPRRSLDIADRCLLVAESQRLADMKAVLECASYKLSISDPTARHSFVTWVEAGRYRNEECLHKPLIVEDEPVTYTEMIATIAWELAENQATLPLLEIRSWDEFMNMLETACIYESEVGQVRGFPCSGLRPADFYGRLPSSCCLWFACDTASKPCGYTPLVFSLIASMPTANLAYAKCSAFRTSRTTSRPISESCRRLSSTRRT